MFGKHHTNPPFFPTRRCYGTTYSGRVIDEDDDGRCIAVEVETPTILKDIRGYRLDYIGSQLYNERRNRFSQGIGILQWDSGAIGGSLLYIRPGFHLEEAPAIEGLIIASTIIRALCIPSVAGLLADRFGRRAIFITAASLYSAGAVGMALSADVYELIVARFTVGCAYGLSTTVVFVLIAEIAPSDIRGRLATTPQMGYSGGTFFAYCMAFGLSFEDNPNWRIMTASLFVPAFSYCAYCCYANLYTLNKLRESKGMTII